MNTALTPITTSFSKESTPFDLPFNNEVEQALLSILLYENKTFEFLPESLLPEHFYNPLHQRIFKTISHFIHNNHLATPITLSQYFKKNAEDTTDETQYLAELGSLLIPARNANDYAYQIYDLYLRRQLIALGQDIVVQAKTYELEGPNAQEHIETIETKLFELSTWGQERSFTPFSSALQEAIASAEVAFKRDSHITGVSTGFIDLDKLLGGLHPSDLVILAARPAMGKTALATNIAFSAAKTYLTKKSEGAKVAFFSLEMSATQLAMRLLGQETGVSSDRIRRGAIETSHLPMFIDIARELSQLPLFIDDTPALSLPSLRTRLRRLKRKEGIDLLVIDYLQLLTTGQRHSENRVQELSTITRGLKAIAKEFDIPVLALSQLSRAVEQREDKRPQLADLRESGTIEQDADVVMFIYREEYYESRKKPTEGSDKMASWKNNMAQIYNLAEVIISKQRHGPTATVNLFFDGARTKFSNFTKNQK